MNNTAGSQVGLFIVIAGAALIVVGLLVWSGALKWFGHLPGDIRIEKENTRIYIPIVTMIVVSLVLSVILHIIRRIF